MSDILRDTLEMRRIRRDGFSKRYFSIYFNERAAIMQFDGQLEREEAEKHAHREAIAEFKRVFPQLSDRSANELLECFKGAIMPDG